MRVLVLLLVVLAGAGWSTAFAAPAQQAAPDPRRLAINTGDLPRGFSAVPERTRFDERPDGVAVYEGSFARRSTPANLAAGPIEVRSGVARSKSPDDATRQFAESRAAFLGSGWKEADVPPLGDQFVGLSGTTEGAGGQTVEHLYLFRKGNWVVLTGVGGRPDVTQMSDAVGFAVIVSKRLDAAVGAAAPGPVPAPGMGGGGERVRAANAGGANINVRAEPSTRAQVLAKVREGTSLEIAGSDRQAEGRTWRNVRLGDGRVGWIASTLLVADGAPASDPSPAAAAAPPPAEPSSAAQSPAPAPTTGEWSARATGTGEGGLKVEGSVRHAKLSSGEQAVRVLVTRDDKPVAGALVKVAIRHSPRQYFEKAAPQTDGDGRSEVAWPMDGPPGTYDVIVEVRLAEDGPVTRAATSFQWK
jgi:hypothetical protein